MASLHNLWENENELRDGAEGGFRAIDRPQSTDQYMEPNQHEDQDVLKFSTEVHDFHHTGQTDRTVPNASGWELWLEPWPDDRFHCTRLCLHRPVFHLMKNSRDGISFGRTNPEIGHRYSILDCTVRTARTTGLELLQNSRPDDRIPRTESRLSRPVLHSKKNGRGRFQFDRMDFKLGRATSFPASLDCPDRVLALSAGHAEDSLNLDSYLQVSILLLLDRCVTSGNDRSLCHRSYHQFSILSDLSSYQPYRKSDPYFGSIKWYQSHSSEIESFIWGLVVEEKACWLRRNPAFEVVKTDFKKIKNLLSIYLEKIPLFTMFGLQRKSNKEKHPRLSVSQTSFKSSLNYCDECVSVQKKPNRWSKEHVNTSKGESDPRRRLLQFDVQQFCDNFVKGVDKALKDVSKSQKKSTSTRAPVAEPYLFISKKAQGESGNHFEELKDFSDSLPIFDESDEELIESLMFCEKDCDLPSLETEFNLDNEQAIVELTVLQPELPSSLVLSPQVFEEEPLDFPHQCPCLDTRICLDDDLDPIFDEEDEPGPVFDEEATSITSIAMENYLCFDPGTSPAPLSSFLNSLPDMFVKISTHDVIRFGLDKMKEFCVSKSVFGNMINSFKIFEPDKFLDQQRFRTDLGISSEIILSFDQSLEQSKVFDHFEKYLELDLKQTDFCATKSFDSFVFKENSFDLNSSRHRLITDDLFASSLDLDNFLIKKMLEQNSLKTETGFCELDFCDSVLQPDLLSFENDKTWNFLRSSCENFVDLSVDDILVYNTFFEKCLESLIVVSQSELMLMCSNVDNDMHVLEMINVVAYLDKILVCNVYFDLHLDRLKSVLLVLGNDILIFDLNKYLSCTFDPGLLVFVLSIQERQVQPLNESIGRAQQPQIWRSFVVQTGYLGASDRGSVQEGYLNSPKVFCLESNFTRKPTHHGFTEAWNRMKSFTDEEVMNFPNRRFFSPSICEYQISKGDSCPRKNRPEPKPILHEPKVFPQSFSCLNQKHCKDHELIASTLHENVLKPRISKRKRILTWLKNVLLKPFHELISLSCALKEIWCRKKHELKWLRPKHSFDFVHDDNFSNLALSLSFHNSFSPWPGFEIDKSIFGNQLTCLMLAHVLDDYPKCLDHVFGVLRIEKPFDYSFTRFDVTDRTVPNASGWELWLEPWPDDRFHCTRLCLHRPVFHLMKNSRDGISFGRTNPEIGHRYSILNCTVRTARTTRRSNPSFQFDRMDFKLGRATSFPAILDCPDRVLALSTGHAEFLGEVISKFRSFFCRTGASHPATIECHRSYHQFSILSDLSSYQPYRKSDPYFGSISYDFPEDRRKDRRREEV
ncbi:hypothetical protein IGI04_035803 [Brassica rapa subsp. trilocularis]|uniref:Uncharacterized protein n=1 Tax=Brassica rapa subsp. trilocularis TaxID=1813537 RepID=A0ABQ7LCM4_BRACM|nr:hypothetical protein IGI04_035803 [Brassica rapa subsp. trilocularis]